MAILPPNAPFTPEQIGWLNGYLAARMQSSGAIATQPATPDPAPSAGLPVTILWGSQTGSSETLAKKAAKKLSAAGHQVTTTDMSEFEVSRLPSIEKLLVITSTYGDGEPPDNALDFHEELHSDGAPQLPGTSFAVLGLGDSEYPDFNQCARDFDSVLEKLGATRLCDRIESDVDYDEPFDLWIAQVSECLAS